MDYNFEAEENLNKTEYNSNLLTVIRIDKYKMLFNRSMSESLYNIAFIQLESIYCEIIPKVLEFAKDEKEYSELENIRTLLKSMLKSYSPESYGQTGVVLSHNIKSKLIDYHKILSIHSNEIGLHVTNKQGDGGMVI